MDRGRFALLLLLALSACGKSENLNINEVTSLHLYPSDPLAAGWNETAVRLNSEEILSSVNLSHDRYLSQLANNEIVIPLEESEFKDPLDARRLPEEREQGEFYAHRARLAEKNKKAPSNWENVLTSTDVANIKLGTSISGPTPFDRSPSEVFVPASIAKLVTANRALETLGADFRFETKVTWSQSGSIASGVTVTGQGDPTLGSTDFGDDDFGRLRNLVRDMKRAGVSEIRGEIKFTSQDSRWDHPVHAPGVEARDSFWCYGALSQAFNLHSNCATVIIRSNGTAQWRDSRIAVPIKTNITVGRYTNLARHVYFDDHGSVTGFGITGTVSKRQRESAVAFPVPNVKAWVTNVFVSHLKEEGVRYNPGQPLTASGAAKSVSTFSPKLSEIVIPMLKESDNFIADALFRRAAIGQYSNLPMREASQKFLTDGIANWTAKVGFPHMKDEILILDGAGLSRDNRSTPRAFLALLKANVNGGNFRSVWNGLPIGGVDGTLKSRLKSSATKGLVRAKTGTLRGSYQLAGYMPQMNPDGSVKSFVPFVILTAAPDGYGARVFKVQEKILVRLSQLLNPILPPVKTRRL